MELQIQESLGVLLAAIDRFDGPVVAAEMARLEDLVMRGRAGLHPQLVHFLERRSYAKALAFLESTGEAPSTSRVQRNPRRERHEPTA